MNFPDDSFPLIFVFVIFLFLVAIFAIAKSRGRRRSGSLPAYRSYPPQQFRPSQSYYDNSLDPSDSYAQGLIAGEVLNEQRRHSQPQQQFMPGIDAPPQPPQSWDAGNQWDSGNNNPPPIDSSLDGSPDYAADIDDSRRDSSSWADSSQTDSGSSGGWDSSSSNDSGSSWDSGSSSSDSGSSSSDSGSSSSDSGSSSSSDY